MAYVIESVEELAQLTSARGASLDQQLSQEVEECLLNRALCTLMRMGVNSRPKTRASLENALGPCTAVVPYANPLDVLADVTESTKHAPSVRIPYAKKRVYVELKKLKEAHQEYLKKHKCTWAAWRSEIDDIASERVVAWLQSDPEGTEETLISDLIEKCGFPVTVRRTNPYIKLFTVSPSRVLTMNMKRLKHRRFQVVEKTTIDISVGWSNPDAVKTETRLTTVFSIGVLPGENEIIKKIEVAPEGVTGIKESTTGPLVPETYISKTNKRLRAVGKCKEFSKILTNRLTYTALDRNAILIPASKTEKIQMNFKVAEWVASFEGTSTHTMIELQQVLINNCVGKIRRLAPSTIIDLLKKFGCITIDDKQLLTYNLPKDRQVIPNTWQDDTVKAAVDRCKCSGLLKKAFPRPNKAFRKKRKAEHDALMVSRLAAFGITIDVAGLKM